LQTAVSEPNTDVGTNGRASKDFLSLIDASFAFSRGRALPLGATLERGGINFSIFSEHATGVTLVLYRPGGPEPMAEFPLDSSINRTGNIWHAFVSGMDPGIQYGYRMACNVGPAFPTKRFDPNVVLFDPYARGCVREPVPDADIARGQVVRRSVIVDTVFDWAHDYPLDYPLADSIVYELHVRAFTKHPSSAVKSPGTFAGLTEKIPYLRELGVTAVELMPIMEFDESDNPRTNPISQTKLVNLWGYHPLAFFAPHLPYGSQQSPEGTLQEMKEMVAAFHAAGIEVILDVVFNHTGEGGPDHHTSSFRGIDDPVYYLVDPATGHYRDYSGCGNTLNCNHPVVRDFVLDCLHYWVTEVHIDGFRFDLASILGRGTDGEVIPNPPLIERIAADPVLASTKLIAEAWDASGLYQVGSFPEGKRWAEWNGKFRDDIRKFLAGQPGMVPALATRLAGSADLYQSAGRAPYHSINFVTCHDGFTLADLVSYDDKHNEANGETNCDGASDNYSWNCGVEGPTDREDIVQLRQRQMKNAITLLLFSHGVPMLLFGDEFGRTQGGNNNLYCHDNERSWVDWDLTSKNENLLYFVRGLIGFRRAHPALRRSSFVPESNASTIRMEWHGVRLSEPDWGVDSRSLALHLSEFNAEAAVDHIYLMSNSFREPLAFDLPAIAGTHWTRVVDTSALPPRDIAPPGFEENLSSQQCYLLQPRSTVVLLGKPGEGS
jgi:isoamylase